MKKVYHADLYGVRGEKYRALEQLDVATTEWQEIHPQSPWYLFKPFDDSLWGEYGKWWKVNEVFPVNSVGIVTARDKLTIHFTPEKLWETIKDFVSLPVEEARRKYQLGKDVRDWKVADAQKDLKESGPVKSNIVPILYRPFDVRYTYYTGKSRGFLCMPRPEVMGHMLAGENLGIYACRQTSIAGWRHVLATNGVTEFCYLSTVTSEAGYLHPLYLYPSGGLRMETERRANLSPDFLQALCHAIGKKSPELTPEDILYYIYAVFHSPTYRSRYTEFLSLDFPRVPLPGSNALFRELSKIGEELVALHLVLKTASPLPNYPVQGTNVVERVRYEEPSSQASSRGRVWINKTQYFEGVPPGVWQFHIGGYQVCEKWLKERKDRTLSLNELEHYRKIVANIGETIRLMEKVDEVIASAGGWPRAFQG
jgi:predicted helicase